MKKMAAILAAVVIAGAVLWWLKDAMVRNGVSMAVKQATGLELRLKSLAVGLANTRIDAKGIEILNPPAFRKDRVFVDLPLLTVDYDLGAFFRGEVHLEEVVLELKELVIVKNADGKLNLEALNPSGAQKSTPQEKAAGQGGKTTGEKSGGPQIRIDRLGLKIGRVVYKDYGAGAEPSVKNFDLRFEGEFKNIRDTRALTALIVANVLSQGAIRSVTKLDPGPLLSGMGLGAGELKDMGIENLGAAAKTIETQAESLLSAAKDKLGAASEKSTDGLGKLFGNLTGEKN